MLTHTKKNVLTALGGFENPSQFQPNKSLSWLSKTSHPKSIHSLEAPRGEKSGIVRNSFPLNKIKTWCPL